MSLDDAKRAMREAAREGATAFDVVKAATEHWTQKELFLAYVQMLRDANPSGPWTAGSVALQSERKDQAYQYEASVTIIHNLEVRYYEKREVEPPRPQGGDVLRIEDRVERVCNDCGGQGIGDYPFACHTCNGTGRL